MHHAHLLLPVDVAQGVLVHNPPVQGLHVAPVSVHEVPAGLVQPPHQTLTIPVHTSSPQFLQEARLELVNDELPVGLVLDDPEHGGEARPAGGHHGGELGLGAHRLGSVEPLKILILEVCCVQMTLGVPDLSLCLRLTGVKQRGHPRLNLRPHYLRSQTEQHSLKLFHDLTKLSDS